MRMIRSGHLARKPSGESYRPRSRTKLIAVEATYLPAKVSGDCALPLPGGEWQASLAGELRRLAKQVEFGLAVDIRSVRTAFHRLSEIAA